MVCIYCKSKTKIINSRHLARSNGNWRRRSCLKCKAIFTTNEEAVLKDYWSIRTKSGALKAFNADKLYISIYNSLQHRQTAIDEARELTNTNINKLLAKNSSIINIDKLLNEVYTSLNNFDKTSATYFKAYYIDK